MNSYIHMGLPMTQTHTTCIKHYDEITFSEDNDEIQTYTKHGGLNNVSPSVFYITDECVNTSVNM
jgi:hypothetical protein